MEDTGEQDVAVAEYAGIGEFLAAELPNARSTILVPIELFE